MQYRNFSKHDLKVSALGFGCMRFPTLGDPGKIDEAEATRMLRYAIDNGVNYIDTAWPYHSETSETLVGKALSQGYREKVYLATKSPVFLIKDPAEYDQYLERQLEKLQTDHVDFYLLHALDKKKWQQCLEHNIFDFISRAKAQGKIKYMGFSFHDELSVFKEIVDGCCNNGTPAGRAPGDNRQFRPPGNLGPGPRAAHSRRMGFKLAVESA